MVVAVAQHRIARVPPPQVFRQGVVFLFGVGKQVIAKRVHCQFLLYVCVPVWDFKQIIPLPKGQLRIFHKKDYKKLQNGVDKRFQKGYNLVAS